MKRISSLPIAEFCPMPDRIGLDIETINAKRSTIFHKYCESGSWPDEIKQLPENDAEEIRKWKKPGNMQITVGEIKVLLKYSEAFKEITVACDKDFNFVEVDESVPQSKIESTYPSVTTCGHLDMAWFIPELNLVVVNDIKSSIFAVKARTKSLQLHGYGICFAKKMGATRYLVALYDACEGRHYIDDAPVELDSWECEEYKGRIAAAVDNTGDSYVKGTHCGGCWKRDICPAHLVDVQGESQFAKVLGPSPSESDVREAMIAMKGLQSLTKKVEEICKDWVTRHGPIRSEDGKKCYRAQMRNGRASLDKDAIMKDLGVKSLDKYEKQGNDFLVYDWMNVKEN